MKIMLAIVAAVALVGCDDSKELSRGKAKDLIENSPEFKAISATFPVASETGAIGWGDDKIAYSMGKLENVLSSLQSQGLVRYQNRYPLYIIDVTPKGREYLIKEEKNSAFGESRIEAVIKLCERHVGEITGIEQPTPQSAKVSFNYNTINPTPFGKTVLTPCSSEVRTGIATMKLFDDGWRLERVNYTDG